MERAGRAAVIGKDLELMKDRLETNKMSFWPVDMFALAVDINGDINQRGTAKLRS